MVVVQNSCSDSFNRRQWKIGCPRPRQGGPSNLRLAGKQRSLESLDKAVDEALAEAGLAGKSLDYAVLALAGSTFEDVRDEVIAWALSRNLSSKVDIIHDAEPVLASGVDHGRGIALIVGTGAVAVGINSKGESATTGAGVIGLVTKAVVLIWDAKPCRQWPKQRIT